MAYLLDGRRSKSLEELVSENRIDILESILNSGKFEPSKTLQLRETFNRSLRVACIFGYKECARLLIQHGVDDSDEDLGYTPAIYCAIKGGHVEIARLLLENGADVNKVCLCVRDTQYTPLMIASKKGLTEAVKLLLEFKADVNVV